MIKKTEVISRFFLKNRVLFLAVLLLVLSFFVFNISGTFDNEKKGQVVETLNSNEENILETVADSTEEFQESVEDVITPMKFRQKK